MLRQARDESGQALIELMAVIIICFILAVGIYEVGAVFHNVTVMNKGLSNAAGYAAEGAPFPVVQSAVVEEAGNLLGGAFLTQRVSANGLILEVWNPHTQTKLGTRTAGGSSYRDQCKTVFPPKRRTVTPYLFWSQGYTIRVGVEYQIGIYVPLLGAITVDTVLVQSKVIQSQNDTDRDGLEDQREVEYVQWAMNQSGDTDWKHPRHRDYVGFLDTDNNVDVDGDGTILSGDGEPYDFNNDGLEDKYDKPNNRMYHNPLIGPTGWLSGVSC